MTPYVALDEEPVGEGEEGRWKGDEGIWWSSSKAGGADGDGGDGGMGNNSHRKEIEERSKRDRRQARVEYLYLCLYLYNVRCIGMLHKLVGLESFLHFCLPTQIPAR